MNPAETGSWQRVSAQTIPFGHLLASQGMAQSPSTHLAAWQSLSVLQLEPRPKPISLEANFWHAPASETPVSTRNAAARNIVRLVGCDRLIKKPP